MGLEVDPAVTADVGVDRLDEAATIASAQTGGGRCDIHLVLDRAVHPRWPLAFDDVFSLAPRKPRKGSEIRGRALVLRDCEFSKAAIQEAVNEAVGLFPQTRDRFLGAIAAEDAARAEQRAATSMREANMRDVVEGIQIPRSR
jgi:hypothetical protein